MRLTTAKAVAELAGVSQATVSLVLNDVPGARFSEETRIRVRSAADELGYMPSRTARALRLGRSDSIVLLIPETPSGANGAIALGTIIDKIAALGFELVLRRLLPGEPLSTLWDAPAPAAIIGAQVPDAANLAAMRAAGVVPLFVDMEKVNARIGALQVRHLAERGHRALAYIGPGDERSQSFARARIRGAIAECRALGLPDPLIEEISVDPSIAVETTSRLRQQAVTGIAAYNDDDAFALLHGCRELKLRVPEDLAVIGVDDLPLGRVASPPISTIRVKEAGLIPAINSLRAGVVEDPLDVRLTLIVRQSS